MNKFYIKIYLDSGATLYGFYEGRDLDMRKVSEDLFVADSNTINGISSASGGALFFNISHVSAYEIRGVS